MDKRESETWEQWGETIGNHYAAPWTKREPDTWADLEKPIGDYYPAPWKNFKRDPQETWAQWGQNIGNYYANKYGSPDQVPDLPQFKREPEPGRSGVRALKIVAPTSTDRQILSPDFPISNSECVFFLRPLIHASC